MKKVIRITKDYYVLDWQDLSKERQANEFEKAKNSGMVYAKYRGLIDEGKKPLYDDEYEQFVKSYCRSRQYEEHIRTTRKDITREYERMESE